MLLAMRFVGLIAGGIAGWQLGAWLSIPQRSPDLLLMILLASLGAALGLLIAPFLTLYPVQWARQRIDSLSAFDLMAAGLGLLVGLLLGALLAWPLSLLPPPFSQFLPILATAVFAYLGVAITVSHQHDIIDLFRHGPATTPSVAARPLLLDTSVIIDGRIADICQTGFLDGELVVPRFVLEELQLIADSSDVLRRNRGRRGLDLLNRLQKDSPVPVRILEHSSDGPVDAALIRVARDLHYVIVTNDFNLNRVAEIQGVRVLNINELATAVRSVVLPGEDLVVRLVQEGKEAGQGVAYLDDGTMVVVDNGRRAIGAERRVVVTRVLQTVAGRMIFAALREEVAAGDSTRGVSGDRPA